jgi:hypothetical protein
VAIVHDVRPISLLLEGFVRARIAASVVLAAAMMLGATGCSLFVPLSTTKLYDSSDGVGATLGSIQVRNALVFTKDGEEASLLVSIINDGEQPADVNIQYEGSEGKLTSTVRLDAGEAKTFGAKGSKQLVLQGINTEPGALFPVYFQSGSDTGKQLVLPVLDASQKEYKGLLPSPTPTPTPSASPSN